MRNYTYEAALKGTAVTSSDKEADDNGIEKYLSTGKPDEGYENVFLNLLLINDDYGLQSCDVFVPYEDHITYIASTEDKTLGESLNKNAEYFGNEKEYVTRALKAETDTELNPEKSKRENIYTENEKNGVKTVTYYTPVLDSKGNAVAVFAASYSTDKVLGTIF